MSGTCSDTDLHIPGKANQTFTHSSTPNARIPNKRTPTYHCVTAAKLLAGAGTWRDCLTTLYPHGLPYDQLEPEEQWEVMRSRGQLPPRSGPSAAAHAAAQGSLNFLTPPHQGGFGDEYDPDKPFDADWAEESRAAEVGGASAGPGRRRRGFGPPMAPDVGAGGGGRAAGAGRGGVGVHREGGRGGAAAARKGGADGMDDLLEWENFDAFKRRDSGEQEEGEASPNLFNMPAAPSHDARSTGRG